MKRIIAILCVVTYLVCGLSLYTSAEEKLVNVALNRNAVATSEYNADYSAAKIVDGTTALWAQGDGDAQPWVMVDLGKAYRISRVEIDSRMDTDQPETRKNFQIIGSLYPDISMGEIIAKSSSTPFPYKGTWQYDVENDGKYRFVFVQKSIANEYFVCAELRVFVKQSEMAVQDISYHDVTDNDLLNKIQLLSTLDIMHGEDAETFGAENEITRGEMAAYTVRAFNYQNLNFDEVKFKDLNLKNPYYREIQIANKLGIITADSEGKLYADTPVTSEQMIKMLLKAAGYEPYYNAKGGYPNGCNRVAQEIRLLRGVSLGLTVTKSQVVNVIYNVLNSKMLEVKTIGESFINYKNDNTVLYSRFKIVKAYGTVTANSITGITDVNGKVNEGYISVDNVLYELSYNNDYLGNRVEFYYEVSDNHLNRIICLFPYQQEVYKIDAENLIDIKNDTVKYYIDSDQNKKASLIISNTADYIYNGRNVGVISDENLIPKTGAVTLIDRDNDGKMDIMFVEKYISYVVDSISYSNGKIVTKFGGGIVDLDIGNHQSTYSVMMNGKEASLADIDEWNIISVGESIVDNGKHTNIIVSKNTYTGKITTIGDDSIQIAYDKEFELTPYIRQDLELNIYGDILLDYQNKIVGINYDASLKDRYAYLIKFALDGSLDKRLKLYVFNSVGDFKILEIADKINIDGEMFKTHQNAYDYLTLLNGGFVPQLIRYKFNSDLEVDMIDTIYPGVNENSEEMLRVSANYQNQAVYYRYEGKIFQGQYCIDDNTVIFSVPSDVSEEESFSIQTDKMFTPNKTYKFVGYNAEGAKPFKAIVISSEAALQPLDGEADCIVIQKLIKSLDDDGNQIDSIGGYCKGNYVTFEVFDETVLSSIKSSIIPGNVLRVILKNNKIYKAEIAFDRTATLSGVVSPDSPYITDDDWSGALYLGQKFTGLGTVYDFDGTKVILKFVASNGNIETAPSALIDLAGHSVLEYDERTNKVQPFMLDNILSYKDYGNDATKIFITAREGYIKNSLVYSFER